MRLCEALDFGDKEVVALTGAGGKTSAMYLLGWELAQERKRTILTTTTRIFPPGPQDADGLIEEGCLAALVEGVQKSGACRLVVSRRHGPDGKLRGIPPEWVESLSRLEGIAGVVVEADGAAGRSIKSPLEHEPVIPPCASLVVPVAGIDAVGRPLDRGIAHRPERVARLTGLSLGDEITSLAVAQVLLHPQGNIKGIDPSGVRVVPLINKVDGPRELEKAREVGHHLLALGATRVILASLAGTEPVVEVLAP